MQKLTNDLIVAAKENALAARQALPLSAEVREIWRHIESIDDDGKHSPEPSPDLSSSNALHCPAAPPHWKGATVFGVVLGPAETVHVEPEVVSPTLLEAITPATPRETLRVSAICIKQHCRQWVAGNTGAQGDGICSLAQRIVQFEQRTPAEADLPDCSRRPVCRWYAQHGGDACRVCPQV